MNGNKGTRLTRQTIFTAFEFSHTPKEIKKIIENKNIITYIYRVQAYDSTMCGYVCISFSDFMPKGKSLLDYPNLFYSNKYEKNDKIILKHFQ